MKSASLKVPSPTLFRWLLVALAMGSIFSGVYEVLPIIDADHLSGAWWQLIIHVILLTKVFKIFFCITFGITICSLGWMAYTVVTSLVTTYGTEPLLLAEHVVTLILVVGLLLMIIAMYRNRKDLGQLSKDSMFLLGSGMLTTSSGIFLGISWGQSRSKREAAQTALEQENEMEALRAQRDAEIEKIHKLHQLIRRIGNSPRIPPDLYP